MPHAQLEDGVRLYYEFSGPEDGPVILQLGDELFGRHNFGLVNDGFRERFRLLSFDARGYGASDHAREAYTIEGGRPTRLGCSPPSASSACSYTARRWAE